MVQFFRHDTASQKAEPISRPPPTVGLGLSALGIVFGDIGTSPLPPVSARLFSNFRGAAPYGKRSPLL
jgi:K+ transporter